MSGGKAGTSATLWCGKFWVVGCNGRDTAVPVGNVESVTAGGIETTGKVAGSCDHPDEVVNKQTATIPTMRRTIAHILPNRGGVWHKWRFV